MSHATREGQSFADHARARASSRALQALALLAIVILAYSPVRNAGFIWDDPIYVTENEHLRTPGGLREIWLRPGATQQYYPVVFTTFWFEYRIWHNQASGYHAVNVLLHAANALLLWALLARLSVPGAWLVAAVFAVHPIHVESVAWITERKDVLSGLFFFLALLAWLSFRRARRPRMYVLALAAFLAGLLSKTAICPLPFVLLLLAWWKEGRVGRRDLLETAPFFGLALALGALHVRLEQGNVAGTGAALDFPFAERLLVAGRAFWFYIGKILWPYPLVPIYPRWRAMETWPVGVLALASAAALLILLYRMRARIGRGPLAALLFYAIMISPALGIVSQAFLRFSFVADHFQYLAGIGISTAVVAGISSVRGLRSLRRALAAALPALLAFLTFRQAALYRDNETLFRHNLAVNPGAWAAENEVGKALLTRGDATDALARFREAARLAPDAPGIQGNLGLALAGTGAHEEALAAYRRGLEREPESAALRVNLASSLLALGRSSEAIAEAEAALRTDPARVSAWNALAGVYLSMKEYERAAASLEKAIEARPDLATLRVNLAEVRKEQGLWDEAERVLREATAIDPGDARARNELEALVREKGERGRVIRENGP
jgi:tetratricopeptide (TPR) repeat protein